MLSVFNNNNYYWSPTARIHLKAFKLVKEGFEVLYKSKFTDERGISLTAYSFLSENSILQAFPLNNLVKTDAFQLCEVTLKKKIHPSLKFAFQETERKISIHLHSEEKFPKCSLWTKEKLFDGAEKTLKEFRAEAPPFWKTYPKAFTILHNLPC